MAITYEYPLNERVRTLMRMEDLFSKFDHYVVQNESLDHHAALLALFEILEVARGDLKADLIQELERQRQTFEPLRQNPDVNAAVLEDVLRNIGETITHLHALSGKLGQHLRDNEWVMSIKQRACIPGGVCEFDLPSYHFWLSQTADTRRTDLNEWIEPFRPLRDAIGIILKILRDSGQSSRRSAQHGGYQQMLSGRVAQMLRVTVEDGLPCFPEISANKYAINIRFIALGGSAKPKACDIDLEFDLTLCAL